MVQGAAIRDGKPARTAGSLPGAGKEKSQPWSRISLWGTALWTCGVYRMRAKCWSLCRASKYVVSSHGQRRFQGYPSVSLIMVKTCYPGDSYIVLTCMKGMRRDGFPETPPITFVRLVAV